MNQKDFIERSEEQRIFKPEFLIIGIGAAAAIALAYFSRLVAESIPPDPPPIIIRSGSFLVETDQDLTPPAPHRSLYKRENFGRIRGIRVTTYNEIDDYSNVDDFVENSDWTQSEGVQVNVNIQFCQTEQNGKCVTWVQGPQINLLDYANNFELVTPINLSNSKGKNHSKRKARREDEETRTMRFGSVEIIKKINGEEIEFYDERDGQEYIIGIYNRLRTS